MAPPPSRDQAADFVRFQKWQLMTLTAPRAHRCGDFMYMANAIQCHPMPSNAHPFTTGIPSRQNADITLRDGYGLSSHGSQVGFVPVMLHWVLSHKRRCRCHASKRTTAQAAAISCYIRLDAVNVRPLETGPFCIILPYPCVKWHPISLCHWYLYIMITSFSRAEAGDSRLFEQYIISAHVPICA